MLAHKEFHNNLKLNLEIVRQNFEATNYAPFPKTFPKIVLHRSSPKEPNIQKAKIAQWKVCA